MESLGTFEQLVLFCVVRLGEEAYGVAIRETLEARSGRSVSFGAIYTALGRLEERGLVTSRVADPVPGRAGRPRKFYRVEPAGARALLTAYRALEAVASDVLPRVAALAEGRS